MPNEPAKVMGGGCGGGLLGALLGIIIGGFLVPMIGMSKSELSKNPDPLAKGISEVIDPCAGFFLMILGAGIGGIIGGVGGSVLGAGLAARNSRPQAENPLSANNP
jgi:hypothetical protein